MNNLKQKIKETMLFSDEDKIAIQTAMDSYSGEDITKLETIIDEFDRKYTEAKGAYKKSVDDVLNTIVSQAKPEEKQKLQNATSTIRSGIDQILG
jgi:hypothetical protein